MVSDPAALKYILSDTAIFARSDQQQRVVRELIGEKTMFYVHGKFPSNSPFFLLIPVTGADHRRLRNIMNPAFSATYIRALPPIFKKVAHRVSIFVIFGLGCL